MNAEIQLIEPLRHLLHIQSTLSEMIQSWEGYAPFMARIVEMESTCVQLMADERTLQSGGALITVAVIGDFSAGKSTFINALLETTVCPVDALPTTSSITTFTHGNVQLIEKQGQQGSRHEISAEQYQNLVKHANGTQIRETHTFHVQLPSPILQHIRLMDTPGFNNPQNELDTGVTEKATQDADVLFVVFDVNKGSLGGSLLQQLERLKASKSGHDVKPMYLLINKAALNANRARILSKLSERHGDLFSDFLLVDSKELANPQDALARHIVWSAAQEAYLQISKRAGFRFEVQGKQPSDERAGNVYQVIDNISHASVMLQAKVEGLASRDTLKSLVLGIAQQKRDILRKRLRSTKSEFNKLWQATLDQLSGEVQSHRETLAESSESDLESWLTKRVDECKEKIAQLLDSEVREALDEETDNELIEEFTFEPDIHEISFDADAAYNLIAWKRIERLIRSEFRKIDKVISHDYQVALDISDSSNPAEIVETFQAAFRQIFTDSQEQFNQYEIEVEGVRFDGEKNLERQRYIQQCCKEIAGLSAAWIRQANLRAGAQGYQTARQAKLVELLESYVKAARDHVL